MLFVSTSSMHKNIFRLISPDIRSDFFLTLSKKLFSLKACQGQLNQVELCCLKLD